MRAAHPIHRRGGQTSDERPSQSSKREAGHIRAVTGFMANQGSRPHDAAMSLSISSVPNVFQSASTAISRATSALSDASATVASATSASEILPAMIDARQQLLYTQAAAKMISTANAMMGSLIDTHA